MVALVLAFGSIATAAPAENRLIAAPATFAEQADFSSYASYVRRQAGQGLPLAANVFDFPSTPVDPKLTIGQAITAAGAPQA